MTRGGPNALPRRLGSEIADSHYRTIGRTVIDASQEQRGLLGPESQRDGTASSQLARKNAALDGNPPQVAIFRDSHLFGHNGIFAALMALRRTYHGLGNYSLGWWLNGKATLVPLARRRVTRSSWHCYIHDIPIPSQSTVPSASLGFRILPPPPRLSHAIISRFVGLASSNIADAMGRFNPHG